jgi:hypothetical protein
MSNINEDALDTFLGQEPKHSEPEKPKRPDIGSEKKVDGST